MLFFSLLLCRCALLSFEHRYSTFYQKQSKKHYRRIWLSSQNKYENCTGIQDYANDIYAPLSFLSFAFIQYNLNNTADPSTG